MALRSGKHTFSAASRRNGKTGGTQISTGHEHVDRQKEEIEEALCRKLRDLFIPDVGLIFNHTTSVFFETDGEDDLRG